LLVVDTMIPIGKGQRELIIGDRNTGKTTIALNAIINQKDKKTKVIYVAIGQKRNSVIQSYNILKENDSMDDSIIIFANPDSSAEQFLAPNIGMAMAEAIAYKGYDVLIVFDDLTKHANVYREVSLSIGRNPGREAYPTDIFYQHSSLLERAGSFNKKYNNGTITALPIVETVQGDIASLIPSNVISITDGQIFTSHDMFNNGEYPAIDVQLSVSRTGSSVQSKMIKRISKSMKAEHAKLFEIKKFAEMSIDVSDDLSKKIEQWNGLNNILLQFGYVGYSKEMIVVLIEMFKAGAMGRLISPRDFSLVIQNFMLEDEVGKIIASKINSGKITKVELKKAIEEIFTPLALAASGEEGTLFSAKEVEAMKGGL
ncbi:MAG: F0F1 ATP synthase subunit alpha, partial [Mycoplasmataceae bacterium]|nr:F0F1 ATP synthase subunit alpha [Mycoplasmataceae bacterium]